MCSCLLCHVFCYKITILAENNTKKPDVFLDANMRSVVIYTYLNICVHFSYICLLYIICCSLLLFQNILCWSVNRSLSILSRHRPQNIIFNDVVSKSDAGVWIVIVDVPIRNSKCSRSNLCSTSLGTTHQTLI